MRRLDGREMAMAQSLPSFQEDLPVELKELEMNQVRQLVWEELWMAFYFQNDERVDHKVHRVLINNKLAVGYVKGASYLQKIVESCTSKKLALPQAMLQCSPFEVKLYFHAFRLLEYGMQKKLGSTPCNYSSSIRIVYAVQLLMMA